jgi:hypothetical protein
MNAGPCERSADLEVVVGVAERPGALGERKRGPRFVAPEVQVGRLREHPRRAARSGGFEALGAG